MNTKTNTKDRTRKNKLSRQAPEPKGITNLKNKIKQHCRA